MAYILIDKHGHRRTIRRNEIENRDLRTQLFEAKQMNEKRLLSDKLQTLRLA
jgi:hypothetical protein